MTVNFRGRWRGRVVGKDAGYSQRVLIAGAATGNGPYPGIVGHTFDVDGPAWSAVLQWNDGASSGWQDSGVTETTSFASPLVVRRTLGGDDAPPSVRDGDFDDVVVAFEHLGPVFEIVQRPFALDRGTLTMLPDGIFDCSQGIQYMGVRIRNNWLFDWTTTGPGGTGMKIGISPASRIALASQGIDIIDAWTLQEQQALGQTVDGGCVRVDNLVIGAERMIYFKIDVTGAGPGKPEIGFVAQRDSYDPDFAAPSRTVRRAIFVSRLSYDPVSGEIVARIPEATLRMRLKKVVVDQEAANDAAEAAWECLEKSPGTRDPGACDPRRLAEELRRLVEALLARRDVDLGRLRWVMDQCESACCRDDDLQEDRRNPFPSGGLAAGSGADNWCRFKPVAWLPIEFEYNIEYEAAFAGPLGPLAFEDPWWKVVLIAAALLLAVGSVLADTVAPAHSATNIIGKIVQKGDTTNNVDCALSDLNGTRGIDLGALDAQSNDVNTTYPIVALGDIVPINRSPGSYFGTVDAMVGDIVWKSGARSATTRGRVKDIFLTTTVKYNAKHMPKSVAYTNQILIEQISSAPQQLSMGGDSGSVWINLANGRATALNFAGPSDDSGLTATANPIRKVIDALAVRFNT